MSSVGSPIDDEEVLKRIVQQAMKEGLAGIDDGFEGLDFGVRESLNDKKPEEAVDEYLADLKRESSQGTYDNHKSRLGFFVDWCRQEGDDGTRRVTSLHELDGQLVKDFRDWRRAESGWKVTTEETQMKTLRKFLRYCERTEWVTENLAKKVPIPTVNPEDESRDTIIRQHTVDEILSYLEKFEYATLQHCAWLVLGKTGCRISGLRALDFDDYVPDEETGKAVIKFRNREETRTRLKNGNNSERDVEVDEEVREVIDDFVKHHRPDVTDDYGREPLFATKHGRLSGSTIRKYAYMWSRPCAITGECPFDRDVSECEAAQTNDRASKCPDSVSPHPIRRGRLTWQLNEGSFPQMISEMYDVSPEVLKKHYDERSHAEKRRLASMWQDMLKDFVLDEVRDSVDR
ncbi:tyrosine-type recombinase/integrase [Haloprofundus halobius]|uniref:tyrosine-type recombinase/integrase n=1 Tax=Haloprofundus halobius TaxID=2876194 RepID=UPI001CCD48E9|nr:site-specific integrase [Haloprofundus halobius]